MCWKKFMGRLVSGRYITSDFQCWFCIPWEKCEMTPLEKNRSIGEKNIFFTFGSVRFFPEKTIEHLMLKLSATVIKFRHLPHGHNNVPTATITKYTKFAPGRKPLTVSIKIHFATRSTVNIGMTIIVPEEENGSDCRAPVSGIFQRRWQSI